jgi:hypothetical protein
MGHKHSMMINWEACETTMKHLKISHRYWIAKHTVGMCGVGKWLVLLQERENDEYCPQCLVFEDACHVWLCPAAEAQTICKEGISRISCWMEDAQTAPELQSVIHTRLTQ